ncbi:hypothetical protein OPV22_008491 [Ensete ventricosum]|uniref:GTD-binding domain-containing protein n=1 Tax=Ensete ventricosum TaxID=4639 RepID=A0AAV8REU7_ENSVE|nr:hypothetical protein OPV22_008491 [Ensete ventricosum]
MDSEEQTAPPGDGGGGGGGGEDTAGGAFACSCLYCGHASTRTASWRRSVRRKLDSRAAGDRSISRVTEGLGAEAGVARVEIENEAAALRETLFSHQRSIQKLQAELEEERSAAASAATETMSMILRLQHEKAEAQMEVRQFKRFAEEKMAHDQQEIAVLEDLLFKRDQAMQALSFEVQAYRHRLLSYGIDILGDAPPSEPQTPDTATTACAVPHFDLLPDDYPPLRCSGDAGVELDDYPSGETPRERLQKLEQRIFQLERMPSSSFSNVMDKGVVVGQSPCSGSRYLRTFSYGSCCSGLNFNNGEEFPAVMDRASDYGGRDDMCDRVYTVDAVHGVSEDYVATPRELQNRRNLGGEARETEIRKLHTRLQALEADRESMRQTLISVGTDKAQMVLLKEIAQQMQKEVGQERSFIKKPSSPKRFSIMSMVKSVISFVFWRKKSSRVKYTFGLSASNVGLLLLLDKSPRVRHRRFLTRT